MTNEPHNQILQAAAREILIPAGLFQVGRSRVWLEDNGYYVTQVEFQPSSYDCGTYLNVGISFLWEASEGLNNTLAFDYGGRVLVDGRQYAAYTGDDEQFAADVKRFVYAAHEKVIEHRQFRDMRSAKRILLQSMPERLFWKEYHLAMLCYLLGDFEAGSRYFQTFFRALMERSAEQGAWFSEFERHCLDKILPECTSRERANCMVLDMIQRRRAYFSAKPSYRKMSKELLIPIA